MAPMMTFADLARPLRLALWVVPDFAHALHPVASFDHDCAMSCRLQRGTRVANQKFTLSNKAIQVGMSRLMVGFARRIFALEKAQVNGFSVQAYSCAPWAIPIALLNAASAPHNGLLASPNAPIKCFPRRPLPHRHAPDTFHPVFDVLRRVFKSGASSARVFCVLGRLFSPERRSAHFCLGLIRGYHARPGGGKVSTDCYVVSVGQKRSMSGDKAPLDGIRLASIYRLINDLKFKTLRSVFPERPSNHGCRSYQKCISDVALPPAFRGSLRDPDVLPAANLGCYRINVNGHEAHLSTIYGQV